jgi:hypothetical protein
LFFSKNADYNILIDRLKRIGSKSTITKVKKNSKLSPRAEIGYIVGISLNRRGYRILNPKNSEGLNARDVVVNEAKCFLKSDEKISLELINESENINPVPKDIKGKSKMEYKFKSIK